MSDEIRIPFKVTLDSKQYKVDQDGAIEVSECELCGEPEVGPYHLCRAIEPLG